MPDLFPSAADLGLPTNMVRIHKAADIGPWRPLSQVKWDVVHDTEGGFAGDEQVLTANDSNIASCHALIAPGGLVVLMVPLDYTAWTPGNDYYAQRSINLEISGFASTGYTDAQYRSYAAYHNWATAQGCPITNEYIARSGRTSGILGHQDVPNPFVAGAFGGRSGHTDPGKLFDWNKFIKYINDGSDIGLDIQNNPKIPLPFEPNPQHKNIGDGVREVVTADSLVVLTNEDFFDAESKALGKRSFTYVQNRAGETFQVEAVQQLDASGKPTGPWKRELWKLVKAYD